MPLLLAVLCLVIINLSIERRERTLPATSLRHSPKRPQSHRHFFLSPYLGLVILFFTTLSPVIAVLPCSSEGVWLAKRSDCDPMSEYVLVIMLAFFTGFATLIASAVLQLPDRSFPRAIELFTEQSWAVRFSAFFNTVAVLLVVKLDPMASLSISLAIASSMTPAFAHLWKHRHLR